MTDRRTAHTVSSMPPTSVRADGPEPPTHLACRMAHPTFGAAAPPAGGYPVPAPPAGPAWPGAGRYPDVPSGAPPGTWPPPAPTGGDPNQHVRIGDRERQLVADELRAHFTAGRIDVDEFSSRLDEVWAATTATDLWTALRQLPRSPARPARGTCPRRAGRADRRGRPPAPAETERRLPAGPGAPPHLRDGGRPPGVRLAAHHARRLFLAGVAAAVLGVARVRAPPAHPAMGAAPDPPGLTLRARPAGRSPPDRAPAPR